MKEHIRNSYSNFKKLSLGYKLFFILSASVSVGIFIKFFKNENTSNYNTSKDYNNGSSNSSYNSNSINASIPEDKKSNGVTFILTHSYNKKLLKDAEFVVKNDINWILDYKNGTIITYTIKKVTENNTCGIIATDSYGDNCQICITEKGDSIIEIEFYYIESDIKLLFSGYVKK